MSRGPEWGSSARDSVGVPLFSKQQEERIRPYLIDFEAFVWWLGLFRRRTRRETWDIIPTLHWLVLLLRILVSNFPSLSSDRGQHALSDHSSHKFWLLLIYMFVVLATVSTLGRKKTPHPPSSYDPQANTWTNKLSVDNIPGGRQHSK